MDFELSDDQVALRDGARSLLDGRATPTQVRAVVDAEGGIDDGLWSAMVEQGWTALAVPKDRGGLGLGMVELACCSIPAESVIRTRWSSRQLGRSMGRSARVRTASGL